MKYQPKRSSAKWLEGAPKAVLAVYDSGVRTIDRYTVLYGAPFWSPEMGRNVPYFAMSEYPRHPQGFGQHGEMPSDNRKALGKKIPFLALPKTCRDAVFADCEEDT